MAHSTAQQLADAKEENPPAIQTARGARCI